MRCHCACSRSLCRKLLLAAGATNLVGRKGRGPPPLTAAELYAKQNAPRDITESTLLRIISIAYSEWIEHKITAGKRAADKFAADKLAAEKLARVGLTSSHSARASPPPTLPPLLESLRSSMHKIHGTKAPIRIEEARMASEKFAGSFDRVSLFRLLCWGTPDVKQTFARFDVDHSGYIEVQELRKALEHHGLNLSTAEAGRIMGVYDRDPNGKLDLSEFAQAVCDLSAADDAFKVKQIPRQVVRDEAFMWMFLWLHIATDSPPEKDEVIQRRTLLGLEQVPRMVANLQRKLVVPMHGKGADPEEYLVQLARVLPPDDLPEAARYAPAMVDVDELLLSWATHWGDWDDDGLGAMLGRQVWGRFHEKHKSLLTVNALTPVPPSETEDPPDPADPTFQAWFDRRETPAPGAGTRRTPLRSPRLRRIRDVRGPEFFARAHANSGLAHDDARLSPRLSPRWDVEGEHHRRLPEGSRELVQPSWAQPF